jgi:hypothetical protein
MHRKYRELFDMFRLRLFVISLVAILVAELLSPLGAIAAAAPKALNLIVSPLPINLATNPGTIISTDLRVKQGNPESEKLKVSLMKFAAYGDAGKPRLEDRGPNDDYFDWVTFDKSTFDAPSNVWQTIKMTINVPKSAQFGYYYAVVFTRAGDDTKPDKGAAIAGGTAVLVLLDAKVPNAKRKIDLVSFAAGHRVYEFLPSHFNILFHNSGNVHLVPAGDIFIKQGSKIVATLPINGEGGNILPQSNRIFQQDWTDGFPYFKQRTKDGKVVQKNGKPVMDLTYDFSKLSHIRFGKYSAQLEAVYDNGVRDEPLEAAISFWVIPWKLILVLILILALVGTGIFFLVRTIVRRFGSGVSRPRKQKVNTPRSR